MTGYSHRGNIDFREIKNINDFSNNEHTSDTKLETNKVPLLFNYQHDNVKNEQQTNLQLYEQNINTVNKPCDIIKMNKNIYCDSNMKNGTKNKLDNIVNNNLRE